MIDVIVGRLVGTARGKKGEIILHHLINNHVARWAKNAITALMFTASAMLIHSAAWSQEAEEDACLVFLEDCTEAIGQVYLRIPACKELRFAKKDCGVEKGSCKIDAQEKRDACLFACQGRACKRQCRRIYRTDKKDCRNVKDACINDARREYLTPECTEERMQNWRNALRTVPSCKDYDDCFKETESNARNDREQSNSSEEQSRDSDSTD